MNATPFYSGVKYFVEGQRAFFSRPNLWPLALLPLMLVLLIYAVLGYFIFFYAGEWTTLLLETLGGNGDSFYAGLLYWTVYLLLGLTLFIIFALLAPGLYETLGAPFLEALVSRFEEDYFHETRTAITWGQSLKVGWDTLLFACGTYMICLLLLIPLFLLPFVGLFIYLAGYGYRLTIAYMIAPGALSKKSVRDLKHWAWTHKGINFGFGIAAALVMFLPVISLVFIPGLLMGAMILVRKEVLPALPPPENQG